ncbi:MAG: adenylate/guanylate cyclase domain-containing protein [Saprospiraceae bacterium]|nr:adenylate/guanylate cyclase domain-containing protein [Saprospiraceae bacterium]
MFPIDIHTINREGKALVIVIVGIIAGLLYPLLSKELGDPYAMVNGLLIGVLGSLYVAMVELYISDPHNRKRGFLARIIRKSLTYTIFFVFLILLVLSISRSIQAGLDYLEYLTSEAFYNLVFKEDFHIIVLYTLLFSTGIIFVNQLSRKMGQGVLWNFITGKYHNPREEERIFMLLDMKDSTSTAEKLGDLGFSNLLNDFFYDITPAIIHTSGVIYRYVGDEVVVSWRMQQGLKNANCIRTSFLAKLVIRRQREKYLNTYGLVPDFRCGFHYGPVVVGQIGDVKSQIAFSGEVMYLASMIESQCKSDNMENLVSGDLLKRMSLPGIYDMQPVSSIVNRAGKKIDLYTITEVSFTQPY